MFSTNNKPVFFGNAIKTSLVYFLIASGWILISDHLVSIFTNQPSELQSFKGLFFVIFTSTLLFLLLFRHHRKQFIAGQKLKDSEDRYRKFVDQLDEIIFRIDLPEAIDHHIAKEKQLDLILNHGFLADYNEAFLSNFSNGRKKDLKKLTISELKPLLNEKLIRKFIEANYDLQNEEVTIYSQNGKMQHFMYNFSGFSNGHEGYLVCIWVTINDITRVRASESRLEMALQGAQLGIWDLHLPSNKVTYNERTAHMLGYEVAELGNDIVIWQELIHPEDLPNLWQAMEKHVAGKASEYNYEFRAKDKNGQYKWVLAVGKVQEYDENGQPLRATGIHMDISERKDAEKKLQENNFFIHSIVNNLQEGLIVYDLENKVILWNNKMEKITGQKFESIIHRDPFTLYPHLKQSGYEKLLSRAKAGAICSSGDIYYKNDQGKAIWYNSIFSPYYSAGGDVVGIIEVLRDISERKKHESNLAHHNKELSKTNEELDNFVYRVSHDLRAPITSSLGLARLSKSEEDKVVLKQYAAMQEKSLVKLDKFIHDILDYSRNSRMEVQMVPINFEQLIKEVLQNHFQHSNQNKAAVETNIHQEVKFNCDELRLRIVLNNLISNALKFQNPYQEKSKIIIQINTNTKGCKIIIADNGMGIAQQHLKKIYQMFYRATDKQPGSGIGLYIVQDCLKKLKGEIKVESELDKGTRFLIVIPQESTNKLEKM